MLGARHPGGELRAIGQRPQMDDAVEIGTWHVETTWTSPGGDERSVEGERGSARQRDPRSPEVDGLDSTPELELNPLLTEE